MTVKEVMKGTKFINKDTTVHIIHAGFSEEDKKKRAVMVVDYCSTHGGDIHEFDDCRVVYAFFKPEQNEFEIATLLGNDETKQEEE